MKIGTRFTTPKQGIELCRQIIREYPDTTYASEARELLRGLPERHQKRYKITDEEMEGLQVRPMRFHGEWNYGIKPRI